MFIATCLPSFQMRSPAIQNDFSYYRRTLNRRKMVHLWMNVLYIISCHRRPFPVVVTVDVCVCVCEWVSECVCVCVCVDGPGRGLGHNAAHCNPYIICEIGNALLVLVTRTYRHVQWLLHLLTAGPCPFLQEDVSAGVNSSAADLPDDIANKMSLFYANPTPMLNTLSGATEKFIQEVNIYVRLDLTCDLSAL